MKPLRQLRRLIVALIGTTVLLVGLALLVLPGPAFVVIPLGLAILGAEFAWARALLKRAKAYIASRINGPRSPGVAPPGPG